MKADAALENVLMTLNSIHVLGMDTGKFENAKRNILAVIDALRNAERNEQHED